MTHTFFLSIRTKLIFGYAIILLIMSMIMIYAISRLSDISELILINNQQSALSQDIVQVYLRLDDMKTTLNRAVNTIESRDGLYADIDRYHAEVSEIFDRLETETTGEGLALVEEAHQDFDEWEPIRTEIIDLIESGRAFRASGLIRDLSDTHYNELFASINQLEDYLKAQSQQAFAESQATALFVQNTIIGAFMIAIILGALLGVFQARGIASTANEVARAAREISEGDVSQMIHTRANDELGQMADSVQQMIEYLKRMATAANQIAAGDLSVQVIPQSEYDVLGNAFSQMIVNLRQDIALRERNAERLREARDIAESANRAKTLFFSNISHELRTPINAIINFTGFVADGFYGEVNDEQQQTLQRVLSSGEHLLSLINDLLDLTKIESGMMQVFFEEFDIVSLLDEVLETAQVLVKNKEIVVINDVKGDFDIIEGDLRRLRQVLLNLLSNAIKYTMQGSVTLEAYQQDEHLYINVTDTGMGIALEDRELILEAFQQGQNSSQLADVASTGLGLPIAKYFVERHNGQLWFDSELGEGTTFHVVLPIKQPQLAEVGHAVTAVG